ncbi:MAG TPA: peroxiredoxin [Phycisphaerales bacterium]|nr:peroxiredoxin [Phycisphaerales bacterium]
MSTAIGEKVSDFELVGHDGETVKLSKQLESGPVVLAFFPMAFTGVCTAEMCEFRDTLKEFESLNCKVYGISVDSRFSLKAFAEQQNLNFVLLSDFNKEVSGGLGILYEDFLGMRGVAKRSVFVVDKNQSVAYKWTTDNAGERPNLDEVREALQNLN